MGSLKDILRWVLKKQEDTVDMHMQTSTYTLLCTCGSLLPQELTSAIDPHPPQAHAVLTSGGIRT